MKQKAKEIFAKGPELTKLISDTMKRLSDIVGSTLGPGGNVVLLERPGMPPSVTKDGVTVINFVAFENATQHVISEAAKEVCQRTNREAGDGTTTAIVLAEAIVRHGLEYLEKNASRSPQEVCRKLNEIVEEITIQLKKEAVAVELDEDLVKVATVSANFDEKIANAVFEAIDMVGNDGTIITEEGTGRDTTVEMQEGFPLNKGLSHLGAIQEIFINNESEQEYTEAEPLILLYDGDLRSPINLGKFLERTFEFFGEPRPVVLIAHKFSPQIIHMLGANFQGNRAQIVPIVTPATAQPNSKHHFLHDLGAFTGATVLDGITNTLNEAEADVYGTCGRVKIGRYQSFFLEQPEGNDIASRMAILKDQIGMAESDYDAELIKERIGRLSGGIATIFVGGHSDLEIKEKKHRIEDAINATRSAIEMGIIPGGGATLFCVAQELTANSKSEGDVSQILAKALVEPFQRIAQNAGENADSIGKAALEINKKREKGTYKTNLVYDSYGHIFGNPFERGIVDPVKVTISALNNALSIAQMLMTIGGTIVIPRDKAEELEAEQQAQNFRNQMQS